MRRGGRAAANQVPVSKVWMPSGLPDICGWKHLFLLRFYLWRELPDRNYGWRREMSVCTTHSTNFQSVYSRKTKRIKTHVPDRDKKKSLGTAWTTGARFAMGAYMTTPAPRPTQLIRSWASSHKGKAAGASERSSPALNVKVRVRGWSVTSLKYVT